MKICMLVYNNATKDGRVMKEAHSLRQAGHDVTVIGVPDADAKAPIEHLEDGTRVLRVLWHAGAYRKLFRSALLRVAPPLFALALLVWGIVAGVRELAIAASGANGPGAFVSGILSNVTWGSAATFVVAIAAIAVAVYLGWRLIAGFGRVVGVGANVATAEREMILRYAEALQNDESFRGEAFPRLPSRIPRWVPDWLLETILEPLDLVVGKAGRFAMYRYRSEEMAALAIKLKPDVIHCHDCLALPTGARVKKALNIPLVYDAHEIYEAVAARTLGVTDYYARLHRRYLPRVDGFITVNRSIALYYRHAYPGAPSATVIRNATNRSKPVAYDGRMHEAAGIPRAQKILLYQGGFAAERGLQTLVRAGVLLPEDWTLVMMGWGPLTGQLQQIAANARRNTRGAARNAVRFLPGVPRSELQAWTAGATAGIIPYENKFLNHWFCTPNKLWEYPSADVPVIVQPFPELRRVVETYGCGWLMADDLTPGTIADRVASLTDAMIAEARVGCRRFIEADNWEAAYEAPLIGLYGTLSAKTSAARHSTERQAPQMQSQAAE